ncbi:hypothetical protein HK104_009820 [Borealophlyctis nickersoniae]|nr:hypothetical protein HK104_009820 [Borealophlyctis nickersoniae]
MIASVTLLAAIPTMAGAGPPWDLAVRAGRIGFVFGDSYSAVDYNINGPAPNPSNPIGNPAFPGVTYLTAKYNRNTLLTYDFAVAGATINGSPSTSLYSMVQEVDNFSNKFSGAPGDSLFAIWIGINDIDSYGSKSASSRQSLIDQYFDLVERLYNRGARRFLFLNIPPIHLSPWAHGTAQSSPETIQASVADFNSRLAGAVSYYRSSRHNDVDAWLFDSNRVFADMLSNPGGYGFTNTDTACNQTQCTLSMTK